MPRRTVTILSRLGIVLLMALGASVEARAQWVSLADAFPGRPETCVLLTDGTAMCHEAGTNRWHRLVPDQDGSYQNGQWDPPGMTIADMPDGTDTSTAGGGCAPCTYAPLYFCSAVLADGRVVVVGGEYNTNGKTWTDIGFLYDPVANSWSAQLTVPFTAGQVGDAQCVVLPDGTLLLAAIRAGAGLNMASFDASTLTFTALNPTSKDDANSEEGWNILPDGRVITVDSSIASSFEIYDPATNSWGTAGATVVNLADFGAGTGNSTEVGPAVARPDGTIVFFSGNPLGQNAVYDINAGTWTNAPAMDFPLVAGETYHYAVADGPTSLLPNGNVLVMASPVSTTNPFNTPSHFFEFDGTNLTQVADSPNAAVFTSYQGRMLLLPSGEVLLTGNNQNGGVDEVQLYQPSGGPQNAWRPIITSAPANVDPGNTYPTSGKQFNGFSEGAAYGDDATMATNYPLVRITNHATGHVFYARTHDHSRMGIEPVGSNEIVTTQFDAPTGLETGPSDLVVVTNGIPSLPVVINGPDLRITKGHAPALFTQGDSGDTFTIVVANVGNSPTSGAVTVADVLPGSLTATAIAGAGWACNLGALTCTRADALPAGAAYPAIVLTVDVASNAPILVTNTATVSGGGQASTVNVTGNDTVHEDVNVRQHTITTPEPAIEDFHDVVTLRATVAPAGVAGSVTFLVAGAFAGVATYNSATGVATLDYLIPLPAGTYSLQADFTSANPLYLDSSGTLPNGLTVLHEETTLSYTGDTVIANGGTATLSAVLLEDGILPIAGRMVSFTLGSGGSAQGCSGVTDAAGSATCAISPVAQPLGPGVVAAGFAGDAFYLPSSAGANTIVFAFLDSGADVVGDLSASVGSDVTFWGARWSMRNDLSGGPAPNGFKGFASTLTAEPPDCNVTWTTRPGDSAHPPATVPAYMGVLVASHVDKSGATISGDVVSIVVVQTDPGYGPNPGHTGTGVVVAQFCHK